MYHNFAESENKRENKDIFNTGSNKIQMYVRYKMKTEK